MSLTKKQGNKDMTNHLKQRLEHEALQAEKEEQIHEEAYWDREYSGDIELGRAKNEIKELKELREKDYEAWGNNQVDYEDTIKDLEKQLDSYNHLKSISWNLNRIANVLEGYKAPDEVGFARAMERMNRDDLLESAKRLRKKYPGTGEKITPENKSAVLAELRKEDEIELTSIREMLKKKRKQTFEESSYE